MKKIKDEVLLKSDLRIKEVETNEYLIREYSRKHQIMQRQHDYLANNLLRGFQC